MGTWDDYANTPTPVLNSKVENDTYYRVEGKYDLVPVQYQNVSNANANSFTHLWEKSEDRNYKTFTLKNKADINNICTQAISTQPGIEIPKRLQTTSAQLPSPMNSILSASPK